MMHTGRMQFAITAIVDDVMDLAAEAEPWAILAHACNHLCGHVMERGDVQAWYVMADICDELLKAPGKEIAS
jgi:hypothetical protein